MRAIWRQTTRILRTNSAQSARKKMHFARKVPRFQGVSTPFLQLWVKIFAMSASKPPKRMTIQFKNHIPRITEALDKGYTHAEIVEQLAENGFTINLATFKSYIRRFSDLIHKERETIKAPQQLATQTESTTKNQARIFSESENSSDPRIIDKIISQTPDLDKLAKIAKGKK